MAETASPPIPIVERLPNGDNPHPSLEGAPEGTIGHPDAALEHAPIEHEGKVIAAPEGHNVQPITTPSEEQVEALIKENKTDEGEHWRGKFLRRDQKQDELEKVA